LRRSNPAALSRRLGEVESCIAELDELRGTLARALRRSRKLPAAPSCVCEIIESQEVSRPNAARPEGPVRRWRASTTTKKEVL